MVRLWAYRYSEWWSLVFPLLRDWNYRMIHSRNQLGTLPTANFRWNESPLSHLFWSRPLLSYCILRTENNLFLLSYIYREQYTARSGPDNATALELVDISKHTSEYAENNTVCQLRSHRLFGYSIALPLFWEIITAVNSISVIKADNYKLARLFYITSANYTKRSPSEVFHSITLFLIRGK
jgi:hypothetical protein